jgi:hypothetical protein
LRFAIHTDRCAAKSIDSGKGPTPPYNMLVTIPLHRGAEVIEASDLDADG